MVGRWWAVGGRRPAARQPHHHHQPTRTTTGRQPGGGLLQAIIAGRHHHQGGLPSCCSMMGRRAPTIIHQSRPYLPSPCLQPPQVPSCHPGPFATPFDGARCACHLKLMLLVSTFVFYKYVYLLPLLPLLLSCGYFSPFYMYTLYVIL